MEARAVVAPAREDWTRISDLSERKKIQNRIAQRKFRSKNTAKARGRGGPPPKSPTVRGSDHGSPVPPSPQPAPSLLRPESLNTNSVDNIDDLFAKDSPTTVVWQNDELQPCGSSPWYHDPASGLGDLHSPVDPNSETTTNYSRTSCSSNSDRDYQPLDAFRGTGYTEDDGHRGATSGLTALMTAQDGQGNTPLHCAAASRKAGIVSLFLAENVDCRIANGQGKTALHIAAEAGNGKIVELLVKADPVPIRLPDHSGSTPLHLAAIQGHEQVVRLLIEAGATT
ncbi:MAG: hypothetical protein M1821_002539 [Bathelium mastoideum]|nr:MAG: hypothetical protein M1821_002539 [Bathelium mastoideum]